MDTETQDLLDKLDALRVKAKIADRRSRSDPLTQEVMHRAELRSAMRIHKETLLAIYSLFPGQSIGKDPTDYLLGELDQASTDRIEDKMLLLSEHLDGLAKDLRGSVQSARTHATTFKGVT